MSILIDVDEEDARIARDFLVRALRLMEVSDERASVAFFTERLSEELGD